MIPAALEMLDEAIIKAINQPLVQERFTADKIVATGSTGLLLLTPASPDTPVPPTLGTITANFLVAADGVVHAPERKSSAHLRYSFVHRQYRRGCRLDPSAVAAVRRHFPRHQ